MENVHIGFAILKIKTTTKHVFWFLFTTIAFAIKFKELFNLNANQNTTQNLSLSMDFNGIYEKRRHITYICKTDAQFLPTVNIVNYAPHSSEYIHTHNNFLQRKHRLSHQKTNIQHPFNMVISIVIIFETH